MIDVLLKHPFFEGKTLSACELLATQGYCNENYVITADNQKYMVRKFLRIDIDRAFEYKVQVAAFHKGITSKVFHVDIENGIMISKFLEGEHKMKLEKADLIRLAHTLKKVHSIKVEGKPVTLELKEKSSKVVQAFQTIATHDTELVLCHNDLNPKNILFNKGTVKLIDWEFAGNNDLYFDLAALSIEFNLTVIDEAYMLASYFQREGWEKEKLEAYKVIYKALCKQWFVENL